MGFLDLAAERYSVRSYSDRPVEQEKIDLMADTWTEGYRKGFILGGKDLSIKKTVNVRYPIGFERVMKKAVEMPIRNAEILI